MNQRIQIYKTTAAETADPGKLLVMVYDACIQWCDRALEAPRGPQGIEPRTKAVNKVLDGLVELTAALDREAGGEIAFNLLRLYEFMSWMLTRSTAERNPEHIEVVRRTLARLREAWSQAADEVRRTGNNPAGVRQAVGVRVFG